ncbi:MAG: class I SAM-dependent DNA methyltransferase, partial [Clostridia bacterium]|nr:class I SAM-dependent DNA methyltransferase [Clostridia bacterium]
YDIPEMIMGNQAMDGGNLIIEEEDYDGFIKQEPKAIPYIKRYMMGYEFINNKKRSCLWLVNCPPETLKSMPLVMKRIQAVQLMRSSSNDAGARKKADTPTLFREQRNPDHFIAVPIVSSERRRYIPMGYLDNSVIAGNKLFIVPDASVYHFGVLSSNVHMSWVRTVAARLKSDYTYSKDIVYNNFPWPDPTPAQKEKIEQTAQAILDARALYPDSSLADLYDPLTMPPELLKAHQANDRAVMQAYGMPIKETDEAACVAWLMRLYQEKVAELEK